MLVEVVVDGGDVKIDVRMRLLQRLHALGTAHQADQLDGVAAVLFEDVDGGDGGTARGQHGVKHQHFALAHVRGQLAVVFHRQVGLRVAVEANVPHLGRGPEVGHAVHHAQPGAQDGHDAQLFAGEHVGLARGHGGLDLDLFEGQVARDLIGHEHADLLEELAEVLGATVFVAH